MRAGVVSGLGEIEKVEARTVVVPLDNPVRIAGRAIEERHYTLVRVAANGLTGIGFCIAGKSATTVVRNILAPIALGRDIGATEDIWERTYRETLLLGRRGVVLRALSALDIALWDLKGKICKSSIAHLLGVYRDRVPAYASGGYDVKGKTTSDLQNEVSCYVELGFSAIKVKIGVVSADEDVRRLAAIRQAIGPDVTLMVDANNAWPDWKTALGVIRRFEDFRIEWVEEPLSPEDIEGHRRLTERLDTKIATGEIEATRWGFAPLIRDRAVDVIQPDAAVAGGISEWKKIAATAATFDLPVAPHWFADVHVHCVASAPNGIWIECFTDSSIFNVTRLFEGTLHVDGGYASIPTEPGLGLELNEREVDRWALDAWSGGRL